MTLRSPFLTLIDIAAKQENKKLYLGRKYRCQSIGGLGGFCYLLCRRHTGFTPHRARLSHVLDVDYYKRLTDYKCMKQKKCDHILPAL